MERDFGLTLKPLCRVVIELGPTQMLVNTPGGTRLIFPVLEARVDGERLRAKLSGPAAADWLTVSPDSNVGTLDVRMTWQTDDGALILVQYRGRTDLSGGPASAPIYVAPLFDTGDERYSWLAACQAVGKGWISDDFTRLEYEFYELA